MHIYVNLLITRASFWARNEYWLEWPVTCWEIQVHNETSGTPVQQEIKQLRWPTHLVVATLHSNIRFFGPRDSSILFNIDQFTHTYIILCTFTGLLVRCDFLLDQSKMYIKYIIWLNGTGPNDLTYTSWEICQTITINNEKSYTSERSSVQTCPQLFEQKAKFLLDMVRN